MGPDEVFDYAKRLRAAGIEEVSFTLERTKEGFVCHVDQVRLSAAAPVEERAAARPLTDEERAHAERERKRARLRVELGYSPPDALLDKLP